MLNFYNYYLNSYRTVRTTNRYDAHKKSELKQVCNTINKINQNSPLYIINLSDEIQQYAIDLKENARQLKNVISSIVEEEDTETSKMFTEKEAVSTDDDKVSVKFIGDYDNIDDSTKLEITVSELASPQINKGSYVYSNSHSLTPGKYAIDISVGNSSYEFQFSVHMRDTNSDVIKKITSAINKADIGIMCSTEKSPENSEKQRIVMVSTSTGAPEYSKTLFNISDLVTGYTDQTGAVDFLGLDNVYSYSSNSHFTINGIPRTSSSNTFTVNKTFELTLNSLIDESEPIQILFQTDKSAISNKLHEFVDSYNQIIDITKKPSENTKNTKLLADIGSVAKCYETELNYMGLILEQDRSINIDDNTLNEYIDKEEESGGTYALFRSFRNPLSRKLDNIVFNPMDYVTKTIVTYPNTSKVATNNYATSMYSGMMFNNYC